MVIVIHSLVQGGPGASSMFGALKEHGPFLADLDMDGEPFVKHNPYTWAGNHSVLYVDNPVGTGFSFTDDPDDFPSFVEETTEVALSKQILFYTCFDIFFISGPVQPSAAVLPAVSWTCWQSFLCHGRELWWKVSFFLFFVNRPTFLHFLHFHFVQICAESWVQDPPGEQEGRPPCQLDADKPW